MKNDFYIFVLFICSQVQNLVLPKHWMRMFFDAHVAIGLQQNVEALQMYTDLLNSGFKKSSYILSHLALAQYNLKGSQRIDY